MLQPGTEHSTPTSSVGGTMEVSNALGSPTKWVLTDEGLWSPNKPGSAGSKENHDFTEPDEEPRRQISTLSRQISTFSRQQSSLSQPFSEIDLNVDIQEVVRQLSEAQEAAAEAQRQAAEAEARQARAEAALAKEAEAATRRKEKAAAILEEARQKRLSQQKAEKAEKSDKAEKADTKPRKAEPLPELEKKPSASTAKLLSIPSTRTPVHRQGHRGLASQSPKGIKTSFKTRREASRSCTRANQEAEAAARAAAEKRKRDLAAILQKASEEAAERERMQEVLATNRSLQVQLQESQAARAELAERFERLSLAWEDVRSRHLGAIEAKPSLSKSGSWRSTEMTDSAPLKSSRRMRRTTGAIFVFLMAAAGTALHLTRPGARFGPQSPQPPRGLRR
mmetsp:Transcript_97764/g.232800  ORF Transcript_97764/g.232800 Transcript_97764/m.232800 type:complete len:394 (+) Transcript_97764:60-1241(+)